MTEKPQIKAREKLFIWRDIAIKLIMLTSEETIIYVFMSKDKQEIVHLDFDPNCQYINSANCSCYKTTLKKLYLYLLTLEYQNTPSAYLIIYANRIIRRMSVEVTAKLLQISILEYQSIETGKVVNLDLEKIALMLNFKTEEFYYNFKTVFENIN